MKVSTAHGVAKSLLVDVDAIIAGENYPEEARHTATASAVVLVTRLLCGLCINMARIADSLDNKETGNAEDD